MNYTVQKGDTLGTIAQKFLGSSSRWREVWTANPSLSDPNKLSIGQVLKIPGQSSAQTALVPVVTPQPTVIRDVTATAIQAPNFMTKLLQDKKMLILLGVGVLGVAFLMMQKNKASA